MKVMDDVASEIVSKMQTAMAAVKADATPLAQPGELFMMVRAMAQFLPAVYPG